jgi:hypothetical protein
MANLVPDRSHSVEWKDNKRLINYKSIGRDLNQPLYQNLPEVTEENRDQPQSGYMAFRPPSSSRIRVKIFVGKPVRFE